MRPYLEKLTRLLAYTLPLFSATGVWYGIWTPHQSLRLGELGLHIAVLALALQTPTISLIYWPKFERCFLLYETFQQHSIYGVRRLDLRVSLRIVLIGAVGSFLCFLAGRMPLLFFCVTLPVGLLNLAMLLSVLIYHAWCALHLRHHHDGYVTVMRIDDHIMSQAGYATAHEVWPIDRLSELFLTDKGYVLTREELLQLLSRSSSL